MSKQAERGEHGLLNSRVATFSVVKHAQSTSVLELIQKIENHPDRHALQQDLRQNQAYNPFSPESKRMIQDVGNVELFELLETDPKRNAKHAYHTGVKASSVAHAGISYNSRRRHQEGKTSRPQVWETSRKQRILPGQ